MENTVSELNIRAFIKSMYPQKEDTALILDPKFLEKMNPLAFIAFNALARKAVCKNMAVGVELMEKAESPIEQMMAAALIYKGTLEFDKISTDDPELRKRTVDKELIIRPQYEIGPYRVDFFITSKYFNRTTYETCRRFVILECDGHDFHEKTKKQAANDKKRDRYLSGHGRVIHFTGSEIFSDAVACAEEIMAGFGDVWI